MLDFPSAPSYARGQHKQIKTALFQNIDAPIALGRIMQKAIIRSLLEMLDSTRWIIVACRPLSNKNRYTPTRNTRLCVYIYMCVRTVVCACVFPAAVFIRTKREWGRGNDAKIIKSRERRGRGMYKSRWQRGAAIGLKKKKKKSVVARSKIHNAN